METETLSNPYTIKTAVFEGPFGLLLELVQSRKLFINDLSLSSVTEDYLQYIREAKNLNPAQILSFISVASTLILIKSKSLLPTLDLTTEEEKDIDDLKDRLKLYEFYSALAVNIKNSFGRNIAFPPKERKNEVLVFLPDERITKESMMGFAQDLLIRMPKKVVLPEVEVKKVVSIEEMISRLTDRIENSLRFNFKEFAGDAKTKEEKVVVIVSFLAMLELVRNGILDALQENNFDEIVIAKFTTVETDLSI